MSVIDKARELGIALLDSPEYRELRAVKASLEADTAIHEMVVSFIRQQLALKAMTEEGSNDSIELTAAVEEMDEIRQKLESNAAFHSFLEAQERFTELIDTVNKEINRCIGTPAEGLSDIDWLN